MTLQHEMASRCRYLVETRGTTTTCSQASSTEYGDRVVRIRWVRPISGKLREPSLVTPYVIVEDALTRKLIGSYYGIEWYSPLHEGAVLKYVDYLRSIMVLDDLVR